MESKPLTYYVERYLEGTISPAEWQVLQELLERPEQEKNLEDLMDTQIAGLAATGVHYPGVTARLKSELLARIHKEGRGGAEPVTDPLVHRVYFLRRWGWAAAILLLAGSAALLITLRNSRKSAPSIAVAPVDIAPGGNRARLTLSDGTTITLDSVADGTIAQQGGARVTKLTNGQLVYHLDGAAEGKVMMNTMATPKGGQYQLTLPDGTKVWLNAASSITYPAVFVAKDRRVSVKGEAYFEVIKDKEKPFIVDDVDGHSKIEVLGTHFNINSYADEGAVRTTLLEGSVRVSHPQMAAVLLKPGQQAAIQPEKISVNAVVNLDQVMAWKNGLFNFEDTDLEEAMRQLERWYDIEVVYEKEIPDIRFGGKMSRNLQLSDLLKILARADVKFRMEGHRLIVLP